MDVDAMTRAMAAIAAFGFAVAVVAACRSDQTSRRPFDEQVRLYKAGSSVVNYEVRGVQSDGYTLLHTAKDGEHKQSIRGSSGAGDEWVLYIVTDSLVAVCSSDGHPLSEPEPGASGAPQCKRGSNDLLNRVIAARRKGSVNLLGLIDVSDYVATPGSPRLLLGAERECYELSKGTDSERAEVCFDDGVLLYGEQQGGASTHIVLEATSYSREVAASEFELPYPPVEPTPSGM